MKQSGHGFVLISVLVMLSLLSFWLTMGMEISGLELKMSQRFFMGAQTDSIGRLGFDKAVIRLPLDVNVCQMKVPLSYEQLENLSVGFWTQYGCKGEMYGRHYVYFYEKLQKSVCLTLDKAHGVQFWRIDIAVMDKAGRYVEKFFRRSVAVAGSERVDEGCVVGLKD